MTDYNSDDNNVDSSIDQDEFSVADVGGDSSAVLEALRTRLLDLTLLNRVLNFKVNAPRVVRIIDDLPDQIFVRLRQGAELEFLPVPIPPAEHELHKKASGGKRERQSVAETYAKELGFDTSFDLPAPLPGSGAIGEAHADSLQTILLPPDLEVALRAISVEARTAVEEKGSNILYLMFGFLEWYEDSSSERAILSPLVMLPVSLRRGDPDRTTGAYRNFVFHTEEDVLSNISLQEKIRRDFRVSLPEISYDETPCQYFDRIEYDISVYPRWRIRRQVALGLLSFTKLFMFRDLDPRNWPTGAGPSDHPIVKELFSGGGSGPEYAREYNFEEGPEFGGSRIVVPPIVMDADSSQHSAIVDAMRGRTMVIEGPPGTGKSQTIANLIAAALGAGKSVLFVADKLTALEVVSRRLDSHGLGIFCLELHSDKTQKSRMMDDIRRRLEARGTFSEPLQLKERLQLLQSARSELNAYARKMNLSFGAMGWTIHDILWGTERRRAQMRASAEPWAGVVLVDAHKLTLQAYEALRATASTFSKVTAAVRPGNAPLENHPFFGVWPTDPRPDWEERILRALQALLQESSHAVASLARVRSQLGDSVPGDASVLSSWASRTLVLGQLGEGAVVGAARLLATDEDRRALAGWCHGVKEYRTRLELVHAQVPDPAARASLMAGAEVLGRLPFEAKLATISEIPVVVAVLRSKLAIADELLTSFSDWLGDLALPRTLEALMLACEVLATLTTVPLDALAFRTALDDDAAFVLEDAVRRSTELATERRALAEAFHLDLLPEDAAVLDAHAATCATAGLFSFLSPEYRAARRQFKILGGVAASDAQRAVGFRALASYQHKLKAFTQDPAIQRVMGAGFRGLDTNFQAVAQARSWQERMMVLARRYRSLSSRLRGMAIAPLDELRELADLGCGASVDVLALRAEVFSALSLKLDASASVQQPLSELLASLDDVVSLCAPVAALARQVWAPSDATVGALISLHTALLQLAEHHDALLIDPHARRALGPSFSFPNTAIDVVDRTVHFAFELWSPDTPAPVRVWFIGDASTANLHDVHQMLAAASQAIQAMNSAEQAFVATGSLLGDHWYRTSGGVRASREPQILHARAKWAFEEREQLSPWLAYLRARAALWSAGGDQLRVVVETDSRVDTSNIDKVAELVVFASLAKQVFDEHPDLRRHEGFAHTTLREKFCEYDTQIMKLHEAQLASRIDARHIPEGVKGAVVKNRTELALLSHELSKQRAHIPIRQLVNRAGGALRGIKPCFMMSPRSVAQYLEAGRHDFDIVIMDEASQLRPEDAIGAIARGRQAVIVGDSRQLPPTSFFTGTGVNEDDEEEFVVETKESILDLAKTAYRPVRQLRWHYRSKHESLIAFSNHQYYDSNLVVFPSPSNGSDELGVKYIEVPDGVCVGGVNDVEARIVVDAVMDHLMTRASESFGIVAMNVKQKERIQILLDERLRDHQELRKIFEEDDGERQGAFIKNLESVQGDERDVIYISVTYGPKTPGGRVARTFGPLNGPNGWRRLNVLFTRARRRVVVFSSFAPEALGDEAALSRGASDLKKYLTFARTGRYLAAKTTDREPDSDFEVSVADALRDAGFVVVPQVGVAGYFIDLAVKHPQRTSEFILGVECDGAAYHSSFSARDRDRLRQQVLEGLHWKIHRIWSTDWFRDPRGQRRRLIEVLRALE